MLLPAWCGPFAPPAPGLAYGDPIGRLVTGTLIGRRLHKTLQQPWTHAVAALEIPAHAPCAQRQDMRGQIGTTHTGPNQKPTHVQDPLQMLAPLREVPSHPIVASPPSAARHCPSLSLRASHGRRLSDSATVGRPTGTPSNNARGASVRSISADVPHRPPRSSAVRRSLGELGERLQERPPAGGAGSDSRKAGPVTASLGKRPQTLVLQLSQRPACRGHLSVALAVLQIQTATNLSGQTPAAGSGIGAEQQGHPFHTFRKGQSLLDGRCG